MNHSQDPESFPKRHAAGQTLDATPYWYGLASQWFDIEWGRSHPESTRVRSLRIKLAGRLGFDVVHAWRNRGLLLAADVVWTHTESEHLAVALVCKLSPRGRGTHVLAQTIWLWDHWDRLGRMKRRVYAWLLRSQSVECTHSPLNVEVSRRAVPGRRVMLVPFGTQSLADLVSPGGKAADTCDVVAPGNDRHRDWATIAEVARLRPRLSFWVASGASSARAVTWPPNVRVERLGDTAAYASLLARAGVCVLALRPNLHASGMTVNVEAASVGTPAVVAGDGGLRALLGPGPRFVPEGDAEAIAGAIDEVLRDAAEGRAEVAQVAARGLTHVDYVTRYALLTDMVCGDRPWNDRVSSLEPQSRPETTGLPAHERRRAARAERHRDAGDG